MSEKCSCEGYFRKIIAGEIIGTFFNWCMLKRGGKLYFSDIFADRRVPENISNDRILRGECLGEAMYIEDFSRLLQAIGWKDFRHMSSVRAAIDNPQIEDLIGNIKFSSRTVRAIKISDFIEDICEEYAQIAIYRGVIEGSEHFFDLDDHHHFEKDLPMSVCGNSAAIVQETRFGRYFEALGDRSKYFAR